MYRIKYTTHSYTVDESNQKNAGTDVTYDTCSYFYLTAPSGGGSATNGQCNASLDVFYAETPRSSSLAGETLCTRGTASSVSYSAANEQWSYTCSGSNGGTTDSCVVDLDFLSSG